jgi:hypothetical protein
MLTGAIAELSENSDRQMNTGKMIAAKRITTIGAIERND